MTRHPFDALSFVLGLVMTGLGIAGLAVATGGLGMEAANVRVFVPVGLIVGALVVLGVTLRRAVR